MHEVTNQRPVLQVIRLEDWGLRATGNGVVGVIDKKAVRIPVVHLFWLTAVWVSHLHNIGFLPVVLLPVFCNRNLVSTRSLPMVYNSWLGCLGHECGSAIHTVTRKRGLKVCRLPGPVKHIGAGDVNKAEGFLTLPLLFDDVVQVIYTVEIESGVRITR